MLTSFLLIVANLGSILNNTLLIQHYCTILYVYLITNPTNVFFHQSVEVTTQTLLAVSGAAPFAHVSLEKYHIKHTFRRSAKHVCKIIVIVMLNSIDFLMKRNYVKMILQHYMSV